MRKTIYYIAALIGLYLILINYTGFTADIGEGLKGTTGVITALQGR